MRVNPALLVVAIATALLAGCGSDANTLNGSAKNAYDLSFDKVRVERQIKGTALQAVYVSYVKAPGPNEQSPVILVVNAPVDAGHSIDFAPPNGRVYRVTTDGSRFPDVASATITFDKLGEVGETASGHFNATFVADTEGIERTLNGTFSATVGQRSAN